MRSFLLIGLFASLVTFAAEAKKTPSSATKYFEEIIYKITPELEKNLRVRGSPLDPKSLAKGFAKIEGPTEGRDQYFLFRGQPADLVIHDVQGPELELKQDFSFYLVKKGEVKKIERSQVFPEAKIKKAFLEGRKALSKMKKENEWKELTDSFELPTKGHDIKLIVANDNPNFFESKTAEKAAVATLSWTGSKFVVKKVDRIKIKKMAE